MRISWLSVSDQLGGSEVVLLNMLKGVRDLRPGWECQVVLPGRGPLCDRVEEAGARCTVVPMPAALARLGESAAIRARWSPSAQVALGLQLAGSALALPAYEAKLATALASFGPDIIHTNGLKAHVLAARVKTPRTVLIWHLHEYVAKRRVTRSLLRRYARRCDAVVANSASVAADVASIFVSPPPMHVIPNAVDLEAFASAGPRADLDALCGLAPSAAGVVRVGLVATFARWKGHDVFLDALQRFPISRPIRGYIVGGAVYDTAGSQYTKDELQAMIDERNLRGRVGLTGFVDAASAMRALDVVVHASREPEPFGLVIAEAMACGRAVITTGTGGAAELVEPDRDALVASPGDAASLAAAIARLAADPPLRDALGDRARVAARSRFAPERMAADLVRVFEQAGSLKPLARSA